MYGLNSLNRPSGNTSLIDGVSFLRYCSTSRCVALPLRAALFISQLATFSPILSRHFCKPSFDPIPNTVVTDGYAFPSISSKLNTSTFLPTVLGSFDVSKSLNLNSFFAIIFHLHLLYHYNIS